MVEDPTDQHIWVQGIRKAFNLQLGLDVLVNNDRTKVFFKPDVSKATCCMCPPPWVHCVAAFFAPALHLLALMCAAAAVWSEVWNPAP